MGTLFAESIAPYDLALQDLNHVLEPPSGTHLFGTDSYGRDIFSRVIAGGRTSIFSSMVLVAIVTTFGTLVGVTCGWFGWGICFLRFLAGHNGVSFVRNRLRCPRLRLLPHHVRDKDNEGVTGRREEQHNHSRVLRVSGLSVQDLFDLAVVNQAQHDGGKHVVKLCPQSCCNLVSYHLLRQGVTVASV